LNINYVQGDSNSSKNYKRLALQQRIGERFAQEVAFTQDPKTREVPSERLIAAKSYTQKKLKEKAAIAGINWTERGPTNIAGRTKSVLFDANDPTGRTIWTGGMGGGLWKSTDDGQTWNPINEFFNSMTITSLAQDPQNPDIIYFGAGESVGSSGRGLGIWKSTNGGQTFTHLPFTNNNRDFDFVNKLVVQVFQGTSTLYAATSSTNASHGGLLFTRDGGTSWFIWKGNSGGVHDFCTDVEIAANGRVLAAFGGRLEDASNIGNFINTESDGVWFSDNGGTSWGLLRQSESFESRIEIATSPDAPYHYYLLCENTLVDNNGVGLPPTIYRSLPEFISNPAINPQLAWAPVIVPNWTDCDQFGGADFTRGQDWYDLALAVYPGAPNSILVGGIDLFLCNIVFDPFTGIFLRDDWFQLSNWQADCNNFQFVHADQHGIFFKNSNEVYVANDGGIYKSNNAFNGLDFSFLGNGLNITQYYSADLDPQAGSNYYLGGTQDNGVLSLDQLAIGTAETVKPGDGMFCHIDQSNANIQIASNFKDFTHATTDRWQTSVLIGDGSKGRFVNPTEYDDINKKVYMTHEPGNYRRWDNPTTGGTTLTTVTVNGFPTNLQDNLPWHVRLSPNVSGRVYFGFDDGTVRRVNNAHIGGNKNATTIFDLGLGSRHAISCVEIEVGNENHMLITLSNYGITSVYESTNATAANPTWRAVEGNLPDMPVRWAMFNPVNADQAFIATELGVWSTDNINGNNTDWGPTNAGLANTRIDMIKHRSSDLQMVIATHGRGIYTTDDLAQDCNGTLTLNNQVISGTNRASNSISISNSTVANSATLSSPNINVNSLTVNQSAQLTVQKDGCQ